VAQPVPNSAALITVLALCSTFFTSLSLRAAEPPDPNTTNNPHTSTEDPEPSLALLAPLDSSHDAMARSVLDFANWLDHFFGDQRIYDESQNSHLKLNLLHISEQGYEPRFEANLQGKLTLPNTQKRLKILIESDPKDDNSADNTVLEAVESQEQSLGLRYIKNFTDWLRGNTDAGVRFRSGSLDSFVRFRLRGLFTLGRWNLRAAETLFWRESTGLGETTRVDFERRFLDDYLFRSTSQATYLDDTRQFDMGQDFFLIHTINKHRAVIYRTGLSAESEPQAHVTSYIFSIRLRQQLHRDWLFFEINPKVVYPQEENFRARSSLTLKLEVIFGGI